MNKIKFGVIGCSGFLRKRIIDAVRKSQYAEIISLASRDINKAERWSHEFDIKHFDTYSSILNRQEIDAIYIALPLGLHEKWSIAAACSKKHVFCEKPLSYSSDSVNKIISSCLKHNVKLSENLACFFHNQHFTVRNMIRNNKIGRVFSMTSSFCIPIFDTKDIRYVKELKGGALDDIGIYPVSMARFMFEEEPYKIHVNLIKNTTYDINTGGCAFLEFPKNKTALIKFEFSGNYENNYTVYGTDGSISVNRAYSIDENYNPRINYIHKSKQEKISVKSMNQYSEAFDGFCLSIINDTKSNFVEMFNCAVAMDKMRELNENSKSIL